MNYNQILTNLNNISPSKLIMPEIETAENHTTSHDKKSIINLRSWAIKYKIPHNALKDLL